MAIRPRSDWAGDLAPVGSIEAETDVRFLIVHHTVASNSYAESDVAPTLRSYFNFHTSAEKGWPDIAYNFLVDRFGVVWEGRQGSIAGPVQGSATGGSQGFAILCAFIGDHSSSPPSTAAIDSMGRLLGQLASTYGINVAPGATTTFVSRGSNRHPRGTEVTTPTIAPHRDMSQTSCPGDAGVRVITDQLIPIASGGAAAVTTQTTSTTEAPTTEATTTETPVTTEATTTEATTEPPTSEATTTSDAASNSEPTTSATTDEVSPSTPAPSATDAAAGSSTTEATTADRAAPTSAQSEQASGLIDDGGSNGLARIAGPVALIAAGLAGLVTLRRRSVSEQIKPQEDS